MKTALVYLATAFCEIAGCRAVSGGRPDRWDTVGAALVIAGPRAA